MFKHDTHATKTKRQLSCMHKKLQATFNKTSLTLPNHITFLEMSNKHHVEYLHQNMLHVSNIIVQIHGQQQVVLMPPISEQHPYDHWLDSTGQFFLNKEIDLSAPDSVLNNEPRLAHATLYSVHLNSGDLLLVPANWFIYRKSLSTSVSISLNYLSDDEWRLFCFQAEPMEQRYDYDHEYLTQENRAVHAWANMEIQQHPHNEYKIIHACKSIQIIIINAAQQVLDLRCLDLTSLPDTIFRIPHLKTLHLAHNKLTSVSLSHMKNLVSLNLACNMLTSVSLSHMKNLISLNLACNELTSFFLHDIKNLVSLNLTSNQLSSFSLSHMKNLISLNLSFNTLTSFSLSHVENIVSLNLTQNNLTSFSLSHIDTLVSLDLSNNQLRSFSSCDLPIITNINLCNNHLSHLSPTCISSINTRKLISLDLRDNPWSINAIIQIYEDLSQRLEIDITAYPIWFLLIKHIQHNAMHYEDFLYRLSCNNIFLPSENNCLKCPITREVPHLVIFLMTSNKHYIIYDTDALIQWIHTQSQLEEFDEEIQDPSTREPLTLKNIISAKQQPVLEYLKQKLEPVCTENMGLIHGYKSQKNVESSSTDVHHPDHFISFFTHHLNELKETLEKVIKNSIFIQTVVRVIKNKLHECLNTHNVTKSAQILLTKSENRATYTFAQQENNNITVLLNFFQCSQKNITDCALPLLQKEHFNINTGPIDIIFQSTMDGKTLCEKRNQLFIKQLSLLTPPCSKEGNHSICTPVMTRVTTDFPDESFESIQWEKKISEIPKQVFSSALISTTQPMIKYLESIQKFLEHTIKISCEKLRKIAIKHPTEVGNDQDVLLFKTIHGMLCAEDTSKHYLVEMYMTGVRIVLFMHNMKENIDHIRYRLQAYRSNIEDVAHQQTMHAAAQKLERHFEHQRHVIKEKSTLFITPLLDEPFAMFPDNLHWTQEELDEQLKNFSRIIWVE